MATLVCFASCKNSSSDSGDDFGNNGGTLQTTPGGTSNSGDSQGWQYSIGYSLGTPPDENLSFENLGLKFSAKEDSEGIYLEFDYPKSEDYWRTIVYVEGLGTIAEEVQDFDTTKTKGCFFYPFVDAGKEYTIRFVSFANEKKDENGFVINGDIVLSWFETKVTAGANSIGEVKFTSKGEIFVDKKGNFKFTKRPTFQTEKLLGDNWFVEIGLVEGISWAHGDERKTDWHGSVEILQADLLKQINFFEELPWLPGIDFICVRPFMNYKHGDKTYRYQWEGFVKDIFYPSKADRTQTIDKNNPSQAINGTWTRKDEWNDTDRLAKVHVVYNETLVIAGTTVKRNCSWKHTKLDGNAFTKEEIADGWCHYRLSNSLDAYEIGDYFHSEAGEFYYDNDSDKKYEYKIYELYSNVMISSDSKTLTEKYDDDPQSISEYFADETYTYEHDGNKHTRTEHNELQVFEDKDLGSELRVIVSGKDNGEDYKYTNVYNKQ